MQSYKANGRHKIVILYSEIIILNLKYEWYKCIIEG